MSITHPAVAETRPILWWASIGAGFAAFQVYLFAAWALSPGFAPIDPGPDTMTEVGTWVMWGVGISFCAMAVLGLAWIVMDLARGRALNIVQLLMIGCAFCLWQDPTVNLLRPVAMYNTHYPNMGSWAEHIPWWFSPNGARNAQPLTFQSALYPVMVPIWVLTGYDDARIERECLRSGANKMLFKREGVAETADDLSIHWNWRETGNRRRFH